MTSVMAGAGLIAAFIMFKILNPFVIIDAGERGIVLDWRGKRPGAWRGAPLQGPGLSKDSRDECKGTGQERRGAAASKDLQDTHSTVALNYLVIPDKVNWILSECRVELRGCHHRSGRPEVVKAVTAKYTAVELITQREKVKAEVRDALRTG
jgi:hypothetical protein